MMLETVLLSTILLSDTVTTDKAQNLDEVVIVSQTARAQKRSVKGQVASIDEHLKELKNVSLVRRGSYAWEPVVNNMAMERVSTTIDGMKIFYACTDKMDPVTSYVESSNLQSILLSSGLNGNPQATGNIGGSLDLKLRKAGFLSHPEWKVGADAGYESNGHLQVYGGEASFASKSFYTNGGVFYRHADNYKEGGGREVPFSQFQKVNAFVNGGYRFPFFEETNGEYDAIEGTFIFDRATNVGYPALNMDVAKAEAYISSLSFKRVWEERLVQSWETKAYYNHITHVMDDTTRPDVLIHMDMPGESWTAGLYSLIRASKEQHELTVNYDLYYNRLFADMTMYPGGAAPMYMVTWPDVGTLNTGVALGDRIRLGSAHTLNLSAKVAWQQQRLNNEEGYHALSVFFPGMQQQYHQTTGRIAANYQLSILNSQFSIGAGWGSRAPTATEAYGYYLNNTYDQYDYIGNPRLKNESAIELNGSYQFTVHNSQLTIGLDANAFFFSNYIIGQFEDRLSAMTVGAEGVKVYGNLSHATIANFSLTSQYTILPWLTWNSRLGYGLGRDNAGESLPMISPFAYTTSMGVHFGRFQGKAEVQGNAAQTKYGKKYGETETPAWTIVNLSANYQFTIHDSQLALRAGIENLFDKRYTTYADWCDIPQKGRNIYLNLSFEL